MQCNVNFRHSTRRRSVTRSTWTSRRARRGSGGGKARRSSERSSRTAKKVILRKVFLSQPTFKYRWTNYSSIGASICPLCVVVRDALKFFVSTCHNKCVITLTFRLGNVTCKTYHYRRTNRIHITATRMLVFLAKFRFSLKWTSTTRSVDTYVLRRTLSIFYKRQPKKITRVSLIFFRNVSKSVS